MLVGGACIEYSRTVWLVKQTCVYSLHVLFHGENKDLLTGDRYGNMQARRRSGHKRKSSTSRTTRIRFDSPKRSRQTESTGQETSHESPSNITCSQRETSHEVPTCSQRETSHEVPTCSQRETSHEAPTCSQRETSHEVSTYSQRGDGITPDASQIDARVESSCPLPNKTSTDQIDDKPCEESTCEAGECVVFHDRESTRLKEVIATRRKEVVQHSNISELSLHLDQEGLLNDEESEYLESGASNREKMSRILDSLKEKPNGFTKFLTCIKREKNHLGHAYIASLLEERQFAPDSDLQLSAECRKRIKGNMVTLVKNIDLPSLVPHLRQSFYLPCISGRTQLLTHDETNKLLLGKETTQNRIRRIFLILETKGPLAHSQFARCMHAADDHKTHRELFEEVFEDLDFPPDPILPSLSSEDEVESDDVCISSRSRKRKSLGSQTPSRKRKSSRNQTKATTQTNSPVKQRQVEEPSPPKTICQEPDDITGSQRVVQTPNADALVESSCPVPSGANTNQIDSKTSEESKHKIEQLITSHHKEVVQHANTFELSSHLVQEGLLNHDESEYLQSEASNQKKMSQLLDSLKEKPNGFGKFLKCIKRETRHMGHSYVASLLEERQFAPDLELELSAECKRRIQNNMEELVEGINLSSLVPHLGESFYLPCIQGTTHLLTADETRKLLFESEIPRDKVRSLFSILDTKGPLAHSRFARCMYAAEDEKTHRELFKEVFKDLDFSPDPILPWLNEEPANQSSMHKNGYLATDKLLPFVPTNKTQLLEMDGVLGGNCYDELMTNLYHLHHNSDGHQQLVTEVEKAMARDDLPLELQALYQIELARSFIFRTQNKRAEEQLSAVLKLSDKILGNNAFFIIGRCHHTLADLFRITNDYDQAKKHSTKALMALHSVKPGLDTATAHYVNGCILLECLSNQHSVTPIDIRLIEKSFHSAINDGKDSDIARRVILPQSHCGLAQLYMSSVSHGVTGDEDNLKKARQSLDACKCQLGFISQISQHVYYVVEADWYRNSGNSSEAVRLTKEACQIAVNITYTPGISSELNSLT